MDKKENHTRKPGARVISTPDSRIPVLIIPTNEELEIATTTMRIVEEKPEVRFSPEKTRAVLPCMEGRLFYVIRAKGRPVWSLILFPLMPLADESEDLFAFIWGKPLDPAIRVEPRQLPFRVRPRVLIHSSRAASNDKTPERYR